ncbi:DUF1080 domain-containing protein [Myxococcota bacterium]|nr:DUF1080 domain-containing protein [Myxococcota bacterium]
MMQWNRFIRGLLKALVVLLAAMAMVLLFTWMGFRVWLNQQPEETRATVGAFGTMELWRQIADMYFPAPIVDQAGFGRTRQPERGHAPWVLRTSLDERPRMLTLAPAEDLWVAYSTETASIHRFWRGDLDLSGAVYDAQHGPEPRSRGEAYLMGETSTDWRVGGAEAWQRARVKWRAHGIDSVTGEVWLRFELRAGGARALVTEWPEVIRSGTRVGLQRKFQWESESGEVELALDLGSGASGLEINGKFVEQSRMLELGPGDTHLVQWFDSPQFSLEDFEDDSNGAGDEFSEHGCSTCHGSYERVTGPAWREIAERYVESNRVEIRTLLSRRVIEGSVGNWGQVPMPPHPDLSTTVAEALVEKALDVDQVSEPPVRSDQDAREAYRWTYEFDNEKRPPGVHPSLEVTPLRPEGFTSRVGGLAWLPDGRLVVVTWDRDGSAFVVEGWEEGLDRVRVKRIAEGLHEPLGVAVVGDDIYVMQKQEITQLVDHDGDGWTDEYRTLANGWQATSNFHEFGFGLVHWGGYLYGALSVCVLPGGKSCPDQTPDRGKVFRVSVETGEIEYLASGLRTPNGVSVGPTGSLFVTDNQGDWLPASKLIRVEPGSFYGWHSPGELETSEPQASAPALWLPQNEVGNSPTQPLVLTQGPYRGQVLFGDIYNGGIKRASLEEVGSVLQGAVFHFTAGLEGGAHRLLETSRGDVVVGEVGSAGNWSERDKLWFGLELLRFKDRAAFEPFAIRAKPTGFEIVFTQPLAPGLELRPQDFALEHWFYVPSELYGGPKYDLEDLRVLRVETSVDRRVVFLEVDGLKPGRVVHFRLSQGIRSQHDEALWTNEAWYTLNVVPHEDSRVESEWRPLFDGKTFDGWKVYGEEEISGWRVEDGSFVFEREVSFLGMVWNHINPLTPAALDLMTRDRYCNFELSVDWKVSPGGNSGIFYAVPNESEDLAWYSGLEMQVLDDERHRDGRLENRRAGDLYDLKGGSKRVAKPAGGWNTARIRVDGDDLTHWLNEETVLEITRHSPEWDAALAASKFSEIEGFGTARCGHILLQDHGDAVWYRNIQIRELR